MSKPHRARYSRIEVEVELGDYIDQIPTDMLEAELGDRDDRSNGESVMRSLVEQAFEACARGRVHDAYALLNRALNPQDPVALAAMYRAAPKFEPML